LLRSVKAVIFDLDGTLTDSLPGLHSSLNEVLLLHNYPAVTKDECRQIIGHGLENLVSSALPEGTNESTIKLCVQEMINAYNKNIFTGTSLYTGITDMLNYVARSNILIAINSNKRQAAVDQIVKVLLNDWHFFPVIGASDKFPLKPDPTVLFYICQQLNLKLNQVCFVGDGETDILMAKAAGITSIAVTWGYRCKEQLVLLNPDYIINQPSDLIRLFNSGQLD